MPAVTVEIGTDRLTAGVLGEVRMAYVDADSSLSGSDLEIQHFETTSAPSLSSCKRRFKTRPTSR
ncbi:hypothetical protein KAX17_03515, partial [Candidatus Bipolaricaulota bacterium]|nr:hypothetical protein [Candidatus Bipolaricaulota bacterium]